MKMPIMLTAKHEEVVLDLKEKLAIAKDAKRVDEKIIDTLQLRNCKLNTSLVAADTKKDKLKEELEEVKKKNKELEEKYAKVVRANLILIKKQEMINEYKRQFKEKVDIACKHEFVDKHNDVKITKHDLNKLTKKDVIELYTLLGLMGD